MKRPNSFEKYHSDLPYSYAYGAFVTIELLTHRPKDVLCVFIDKKFQNQEVLNFILKLCNQEHIPLEYNQKIIKKIRTKENCLIIGAFLKKQYPFCGKRHLLIKDIEDEGTLGTIIRSVRGFEFNHLVLIHPQIDYYHPHVIRASMGSFFSTYLIVFPTIEAYQQAYPKQNIYYCQKNGTLPLNQLDKKLSPLSLCFAENKKTTNSIQINEQCSLENNVNIVLFHFYSS